MAGIIGSAISAPQNPPNGTVFASQPDAVDPSLRTVDPAKETVAGQLNNILQAPGSGVSELQQSAQTGAMDTAQSRGLLNSTMAATAGEKALIDSSLPIAQADAATYGQTNQQNTAQKNQTAQFNATASNDAGTNLAAAANNLGQQQLKGQQATDLANIEANYKTIMQSSSSAAQLYGTTIQSINQILSDPNTSDAQKQSQVNSITNTLKSGLGVIGSMGNLDLSGLLDFSGITGTPAPAVGASGTNGGAVQPYAPPDFSQAYSGA